MMLSLDPDQRSEPGGGAACASHTITFVAPLSLPLNDSHQSCTPWSVFQDGSLHAAALMTGRAALRWPTCRTPGRNAPASTSVDTCGTGPQPLLVYKASPLRESHLPRRRMRAASSGSTGSGPGTSAPCGSPWKARSWRRVNRFPYNNFTYF
jgi:hypothetical protein